MVFSSLVFLFVFLPIILTGYYILKGKYRNYFLLLASLFFYAFGEPIYIFLMTTSILFNYFFGLLVSKSFKGNRKFWLITSLAFNIGTLMIFKYTGFFIYNTNSFLGTSITIPSIALPLGISFFTFQALSYVIDVYKEEVKPQKNLFNLALYISLFPQLVAGPIVRYKTIATQIKNRVHSIEGFADGVNRFIIGLSKKILIANELGKISDYIFSIPPNDISIATSWIGILSYTLQIFFDFSGYSDMAIGLGKMFGFSFLENFNYPYISQSVSEFWRRWHISLGSWFRDYVYIPLGGNRKGPIKVYFNIFVVWILTGFWHGASWTFIAWGLYFGVLISLEKAFLNKLLLKVYRPIRHLYLLLTVIISWVFFRSDNFSYSLNYLKTMFGLNNVGLSDNLTYVYIHDYCFIFIIGILFSTPIIKYIKNLLVSLNIKFIKSTTFYVVKGFVYALLFLIVILELVNSTYNPFLYFRF